MADYLHINFDKIKKAYIGLQEYETALDTINDTITLIGEIIEGCTGEAAMAIRESSYYLHKQIKTQMDEISNLVYIFKSYYSGMTMIITPLAETTDVIVDKDDVKLRLWAIKREIGNLDNSAKRVVESDYVDTSIPEHYSEGHKRAIQEDLRKLEANYNTLCDAIQYNKRKTGSLLGFLDEMEPLMDKVERFAQEDTICAGIANVLFSWLDERYSEKKKYEINQDALDKLVDFINNDTDETIDQVNENDPPYSGKPPSIPPNTGGAGGSVGNPDDIRDPGDIADIPDEIGDPGNETDIPDDIVDTENESDIPDEIGDSGDATDIPDKTGDPDDATDIPDEIGDSGDASDVPDNIGDAGGAVDIPDELGDAGGDTDIPDYIGNPGDTTDIPDEIGDLGNVTDIPDDIGDPEGIADMPDDLGDAGGETDMPDSIRDDER